MRSAAEGARADRGEAMLSIVEPQTSRREQAKNERRVRIVDATHSLLREVGMEDLSIKLVAERAGVSPATVYNLFGTKGAVLARVFDLDLLGFQKLVDEAPSQDALERIFDAIAIAAQLYRKEPEFYRATMWSRGSVREGDGEVPWAVREPRTRFWTSMVENAIAEGHLRPRTNTRVLGVLMIQIAAGVLSDWVLNIVSVDQLERETSFGFAILLEHYATKESGRRLRARIAALEAALSSGHRQD
jgi:AcrR family transcriptional regulator